METSLDDSAVAGLLNEIIGNDFAPEKIVEYQEILQTKIELKSSEEGIAKNRLETIENERKRVLELAAESNRQTIERTKNVLKMVDEVGGEVGEIVQRTIKLDTEQRNLSMIITMLERFKAMVANIGRLERLLMEKDFGKMAGILLATLQFAEQFKNVKEANLVNTALGRLKYLEELMGKQIMELFESSFGRKNRELLERDRILLAYAATVVDVLGGEYRKRLISWYVNRQLSDYKDVFRSSELFNLESLQKRLPWLYRVFTEFDRSHRRIFPDHWRVDYALCSDACAITVADLVKILKECGKDVDLLRLQTAVQQTRQFELDLARRFDGGRRPELVLSLAFEPYLSLFVQAHEREIGEFVCGLPSAGKLVLGDFDAASVLASATALFLMFKEIIEDTVQLSNKKPLGDLCAIFATHLVSYAKYLERIIPNSSSKPFEIKLFCVLVNTADYCAHTLTQMEERLKELIDRKCVDEVQFGEAAQAFHVQIANTSARLRRQLEAAVEPAWSELKSFKWASLKAVGDHGRWINRAREGLGHLYQIRNTIIEARYYVELCRSLAKSILASFHGTFQMITPLSETVVQQLLVDLEVLKGMLLDVMLPPSYGSLRDEFFKEIIAKETMFSERLLKCLLLPIEPVTFLVQNYLVIMADGDQTVFKRFLELAGVKKIKMDGYLEEFGKCLPERPSTDIMRKVGTSEKRSVFTPLKNYLKEVTNTIKKNP